MTASPPDWPGLGGKMQGDRHVMPVRIYFEDTDFSGVVYHGAYVRFFERGRSEFLRQSGVGHADLHEDPAGMAFVVRRMTIAFDRAAKIDDVLAVETWMDEMKGATMRLGQRISRAGETVSTADVTAAVIGRDGRPRRIPEVLRRAFGGPGR
ncbi:MAG: YbgC/FadM family acyl-CoA thioesterase [Pseudomonadota bacterium]